ncbi:scavenger receptor cysteine-rich type 1 protein M130-like [Girardinichthys multiradiatus]|uniref:scavenger receptor cysteine-rich type 1 protein M130-like n=1 Tax=Girardinichthys multiradiatus TaxID=208333 RepID=UPI001FADB103|nr:scavenger receptor cysteine-rich type 1 protein M130-like [Girardinichthys multiradiatus]
MRVVKLQPRKSKHKRALYYGKHKQVLCDEVRLVAGSSRCGGRLEEKDLGVWKPVIDEELNWNLTSAAEVCRQLHCGSVVSLRRAETSNVEILCSDSVRLVNGTSLCSGRLAVRSDQFSQSWSSVAEDGFDLQDAEVVCRELDCGPPLVLQGALFGETETPTWSREFQCEGDEAALFDCGTSGRKSSGRAVGLTCSDSIRLVGEASRCAGTLEMLNRGQWRPVTDRDNNWNKYLAAKVCGELDCGAAVSARKSKEPSDKPFWWIVSSCLQSARALRGCLTEYHFGSSDLSIELICSDLLVEPHIFLSLSTDGVSTARRQGSELPIGSDFSIICSIRPQYEGGSFQLIFSTSNSAQNHTLPAVNYSALFLFSDAGHAHRGTYRCVYHVYVFSHNFSISQVLSLTVSGKLIET